MSGYMFRYQDKAYNVDGNKPVTLTQKAVDDNNNKVSMQEIAFINREKPENIFCYPKQYVVTTWIGDLLGVIISYGQFHKGNMGDTRQPITVNISGTYYYGTIYNDLYCRLKRKKSRK